MHFIANFWIDLRLQKSSKGFFLLILAKIDAPYVHIILIDSEVSMIHIFRYELEKWL